MNILVLHNNNLPFPLRKMFSVKLPGDHSYRMIPISQDPTDNDDFDVFLDKILQNKLDQEYDLIILTPSLSATNPLEYSGIRCASHIRLDRRYKNTKTPILFIGPEPLEEVLRLSDLGSFLLTPSVFLSDVNTVEQFNEWLKVHATEIKALDDSDYSRFLNRFEVNPPANFADDHHSVANIWGATILCRQITNKEIPSNNENVGALRTLFFKYVLAKRDSVEGNNPTGPGESDTLAIGKGILLIDDEAEKGWGYALQKYLAGAKVFDIIPNRLSCYEDIPETYRKKIEREDYDLVFLDLRLNGPDEEENLDPEQFSGMKILKKIKEINKGIQVIMFTASNKAWNLKALLDAGADGYYIKQSPEYYTERFAENNFQSFKETVKHCLTRTFLKSIYKRIIDLKQICKDTLEKEDYSPIEKYFEQSFFLFSFTGDGSQYKYAFLTLFGVLEEIVRLWIDPAGKNEPLFYFNGSPVTPWDIDRYGNSFNIHDAAKGDFAISRKIIAIYKDQLVNTGVSFDLYTAMRIYNLVKRRNGFVHNNDSILPYPTIKTPELGDRHAYEDLFEIVEKFIQDSFL